MFALSPADVARGLQTRAHHLALIALLALFSASLAELARDPTRPPHIDEPAWITSSYLTYRLVVDAAPRSRWDRVYDEAQLGFWGNMNPPVGKFLTGALVAILRDPSHPVDYRWEWPHSTEENRARGNLPPQRLLVGVRLGMAALSVLTLALVYASALQITGMRWIAFVAPVALFLSPVFQIHATQVTMDTPQLLFQAMAVFAFGAFIRRGSRVAFASSLVAMGLACAVKFSSAPIVLATGLFVLLRREPIWQRLGKALSVAVVPLAVFIAVNPYLYPDPIGRTRGILRGWSEVKAQQSRDPRLVPGVVASPLDGLARTAMATVGRPDFFHPRLVPLRRWLWLGALVGLAALLAAVRRYRFELPGAPARFAAPALIALLSTWLALRALDAAGLSLLLAAIGTFWLLGIRRVESSGPPDPELAVYLGLCATSMWLLTGLWLPFDWGRYTLPMLVLVPGFYAAGAAFFLDLARTRRPRAQRAACAQNASYGVE